MKLIPAALTFLLASACATVPVAPMIEPATTRPTDTTPLPLPDPRAPPAPPGMQWLYGSGEGMAASVQTYRAMRDHVAEAARRRPSNSVILAGPLSGGPNFVPCGRKPLAVLLDADETAIQNLGYEHAVAVLDKTGDRELLNRWQSAGRANAAAMPGAIEAFADFRKRGVTILINSNRDRKNAAATAETLALAGLGRFVPGETLFTRGDVDGQSGKDGRRAYIAGRYCVVAMAGDQLADFSDGFNERSLSPRARRLLAQRYSGLWGDGWFMLSNPVYGPGLNGSTDEVFAPNERWTGER